MVSPILAEPSYAGCVVVMVFFAFLMCISVERQVFLQLYVAQAHLEWCRVLVVKLLLMFYLYESIHFFIFIYHQQHPVAKCSIA